jgi:ATP-dependent DNA helicase RecQ
VVYALKALEQEELLSFNEQVFLPSKIFFTTNKELLYDFEKNNPKLEPVIKALLRTYSGIFDQLVNIHEKTIAFLLHKELNELISDLKRLHSFGIIQYVPQKDSPQLYFMQNRIKAEDLRIDMINYKKRKEQYRKRIGILLEYIKKDMQCRSQFIANYFGDDDAKPCGICDNCLRQKNIHITNKEFENIHQRIVQTLQSHPVDAKELLQMLNGINKEKAWKVINHLQAENKLVVDKNGMVKLR